ncbi:MAG: hypothetical protein V3S64_00175 [bacterium]
MRKIRLILKRTFLVEVQNIACEPEKDEDLRQHHGYRIHSQFINPHHGMQMPVMLDEMNQPKVDVDVNDDDKPPKKMP